MTDILTTSTNEIKIKTCFNADLEEFETCIEYSDGKVEVLESFKSAMFLLEIHTFWCKFTGIIKDSIDVASIINHIKTA